MHRAHVAFRRRYDAAQNLEVDAQPPQGGHPRQRRLRFQSVFGVAQRHGAAAAFLNNPNVDPNDPDRTA